MEGRNVGKQEEEYIGDEELIKLTQTDSGYSDESEGSDDDDDIDKELHSQTPAFLREAKAEEKKKERERRRAEEKERKKNEEHHHKLWNPLWGMMKEGKEKKKKKKVKSSSEGRGKGSFSDDMDSLSQLERTLKAEALNNMEEYESILKEQRELNDDVERHRREREEREREERERERSVGWNAQPHYENRNNSNPGPLD